MTPGTCNHSGYPPYVHTFTGRIFPDQKRLTSSTTHITPVRPSNASFNHFWNISILTLRPNGNLAHRYRPNGVTIVVSFLDSVSSSTCQNASCTSTLLKTLALFRLGKISSRFGNLQCSLISASFSGCGSMHNCNLPFCLRITAIWLTHGVGSSTVYVSLPSG